MNNYLEKITTSSKTMWDIKNISKIVMEKIKESSRSKPPTSSLEPRTLTHRGIALFFVLIFLQTLIPYNQLRANNNGPNAPEAASFEPVDATDMVSLLSGDFTYVLPLIDIPGPEGGYPLALSYHAGIAVDQEASWVGLGWSLNPGAINRSVAGVPDDWETTKKYSILYDEGGVQKRYSGGVSVGWGNGVVSAGLYASYTENKAASGENSYRTDFGVTGSVGIKGTGLGISGRLGTDGIGLGVTYNAGRTSETASDHTTFGATLSQSFIDGTTSLSGSASGVSMGVSFSSRNGLRGNIANVSIGSNGSNTLSSQVSVVSTGFIAQLPIPIGTTGVSVNINASYRKTKYWVYENDYSVFDGALYAGNLSTSMEENMFSYKNAFDSYESFYTTDRITEMQNANYTAIAYDGYSVSGQGISGSIKPYVFEQAILRNQTLIIDSDSKGESQITASYLYPTGLKGSRFTKSFNDIHFYFENENSSFLRITTDDWSYTPNANYQSIYDLDTSFTNIETSIQKDGKTYYGFNESNKRLRKGSYIETFTNSQVLNNPLNFIKPANFDRSRATIPLDGIGAYRITTADGKVYHYSLPVYQHEKISRVTGINEKIDIKYSEEMQLQPYATHWLLTAVTGPDYVDTNNNNRVDESDYGYWVDFDYGLWSEGFGWRTPKIGTEDGEKSKVYEWGIKEVYYLDKIKTRTHTALFVKSERKDNLSSSTTISIGPKTFPDLHMNSFIKGDDGKQYFNGVYSEVIPYPNTYRIESEHVFYSKLYAQTSLKLDKIILLKNSNSIVGEISKAKSNIRGEKGGEIDIKERFTSFDLLGKDLGTVTNPIHNRSWNAMLFSNILDVNDLPSDINSIALKTIQFNTNLELASNSPNSIKNGGRLTLKSLDIKGKKSIQLVPSYRFSYKNSTNPFDKNNADDWGFNKNAPDTWSLNKITTPIGSSINIEYEPDTYRYEAAVTSTSESNKVGGGIRVKNVSLDYNNEKFVTSYKYTMPASTLSSGVTSFSPSKNEKEVKYISEIPGPGVMYEYVTVEQKYATKKVKLKDIYHFKVMPKMKESNGGFQLGDIVTLSRKQNDNSSVRIGGENLSVNFTKFDLIDNKASLGNLISKKTYNSRNQIVGLEENEYYDSNQLEQGVLQETSKVYKKVRNYSNYKYLMSSSSKTKTPSVLKSKRVYSNNYDFVTKYEEYDFLTGNVLEAITNNSEGLELKTESIPAYHQYKQMDTKADNLRNKNMLLQDASNFLFYKNSTGNWSVLDASVQTWKPWTDNEIWRKHKSFTWKGGLNDDGSYKEPVDFNWIENDVQNLGWQKISEITKYNEFSKPLETLDINGNKASIKMGDKDTKVFAVCNAGYNEMFYNGAEGDNYGYNSGGVFYLRDNAGPIGVVSHTGKISVSVRPEKKGFTVEKVGLSGDYKVSVWVDNRNDVELYKSVALEFETPSGAKRISYHPEEVVFAGDWVQLNFYANLQTTYKNIGILNTSLSKDISHDDFRMHPVASSMVSYVYNEWDELTYVLGANNLATKYEYDAAGRLKKTFVETIDTPEIKGGFKMINQLDYHYKNK